MTIIEEIYSKREMASRVAAERLALLLRRRLVTNATAALVVSGGSTPVGCFEELSALPLAWDRVHVTLSDERWVPASDEASNERMIRDKLLVDKAATASFLPLYRETSTHAAVCADLEREIRSLPLPFACSLLGMGNDGHFASLFPDFDKLDEALSLDNDKHCVAVTTAASPLPRVSLTLSALLASDEIVLLAFSDEKKRIYDRAKTSPGAYPISALLNQERTAVRLIWAP